MKIDGIAFCGDSFCGAAGPGTPAGWSYDSNHEFDWPYLIAQHFNAEITCTGIGGVNFYHSLQSLFGLDSHYTSNRTLNETDLVIFVVTDPHRMINRDRLTMNDRWINEIAKWSGDENPASVVNLFYRDAIIGPQSLRIKKFKKEPFTIEELIKKATIVKDYTDNIADWQSQKVLQHALIMFIDERMVTMKKKAIWLDAFGNGNRDIPGWCNRYRPLSGPVGNIPLWDISLTEVSQEILERTDDRRNHLSPRLNKVFATMLIDVIENDRLEPGILDMRPWFDVSIKLADNPDDSFIYP